MKTNDYVKYVTQQFVSYIDKPKEIRKQTRKQRKDEQAPFSNRWFGILPIALMLLIKRSRKH
ncbi:YqzE family protein [Ferdinandcohnia quinoae]|uniref:YqzE family protein n=1 Tax=Fredinandcohnia quinoae TaxID=2918902 RepID=A0AAW5E5M3_9BACI|nr:YqzE family protein [Fredinandcohnia sp. SECRCQ15]MCH1624910.1 YqzE family protein [Fredinandcohnia sp. SECRCQ15]